MRDCHNITFSRSGRVRESFFPTVHSLCNAKHCFRCALLPKYDEMNALGQSEREQERVAVKPRCGKQNNDKRTIFRVGFRAVFFTSYHSYYFHFVTESGPHTVVVFSASTSSGRKKRFRNSFYLDRNGVYFTFVSVEVTKKGRKFLFFGRRQW